MFSASDSRTVSLMVGSISLISGFVSVGSLTPLEILLRTSSPLILQRGPVPLISLRDSPLFDAILRAAGEARILSGTSLDLIKSPPRSRSSSSSTS